MGARGRGGRGMIIEEWRVKEERGGCGEKGNGDGLSGRESIRDGRKG